MPQQPALAVIGAGIAGLTWARELAAVGLDPVVFEKGRGLGGHAATIGLSTGVTYLAVVGLGGLIALLFAAGYHHIGEVNDGLLG